MVGRAVAVVVRIDEQTVAGVPPVAVVGAAVGRLVGTARVDTDRFEIASVG